MNYSSAEYLQKGYFYCSAVHCAYYSSLQLMRHIIIHKIGKSALQIKQESGNDPENRGFHQYMIKQTADYLYIKNKKDMALFVTNMNSLRKLRVASDYEEVNIDISKGNNSILLSESVNKILKTIL
ncbi:hypothetical protein J7E50_07095 [Pedobacter sp. ISL-68]|nr:hypothetical protein [Pedobacter sp. ISL-68]MBT2589975.1 hypothetical protein [Pedobacter sp. ISL-68]